MRLTTALAAIVFLFGIPVASAQTLYLIVATDSDDGQLGPGFVNNSQQVIDLAKNVIGKYAQLKPHKPIEIKGQDYYCDNFSKKFDAAVKTVSDDIAADIVRDGRTESDDVILFYNSGHGSTSKRGDQDTTPNKFPALECALRGDPAIDNGKVNVRLIDIATKLQAAKARLTIVVADSCNVYVPRDLQAKTAGVVARPIAQIKAMYRDFKGSLIMAAASPGQFAYYFWNKANKDGYGFFTDQVLGAHANPMNPNPATFNTLWDVAVARSMETIDPRSRGLGPADIQPYTKDGDFKIEPGKQITQSPIFEPRLAYAPVAADIATAGPTPRAALVVAPNQSLKLRSGDAGSEVKALRRTLSAWGYQKLSKGDEFDNNAEDAVRDFQKRYGLNVDGVAGPVTRSKLGQ